MSREITVVTPENIPLHLELAGLGSRFGALLIDLLAQALVLLVLLIIGITVAAATAAFSAGISSLAWAGLILGAFLILFGYFILFETIWNGQTPGKKVFGLRVIRDGGYPVNVFSVVARNLIRLADFLPANYGVGALVVFFNPQYKRLGDLAAGTLVIKERQVQPLDVVTASAPDRRAGVAPTLPPTVHHPSDVLTPEELALLRRYAVRRWEMTPDDSERLAYRLVVPLIPRLNLTFVSGVAPRYADLVSVLVAAADARENDGFR